MTKKFIISTKGYARGTLERDIEVEAINKDEAISLWKKNPSIGNIIHQEFITQHIDDEEIVYD
jgi:hypothetical protein